MRADAAIVTEPTELELVVAHKGFVWFEIEVHGPRRARLAAAPRRRRDRQGRARSSRALGELDAALGARTHPLLGRGSVHASLIEGGDELSSYPARCTLGLERRTLPGETAADVEAELDALLDRCRAADPELARAAHAARARAVRGRRRTPRSSALVRAPPRALGARRRSAARATGPTRRSSRPPASRPCCSARAARALTRPRSGSASSDTEARRPHARRRRASGSAR